MKLQKKERNCVPAITEHFASHKDYVNCCRAHNEKTWFKHRHLKKGKGKRAEAELEALYDQHMMCE